MRIDGQVRKRPAGHGRWMSGLRSFYARHDSLRYLQIIPIGVLLWGLDAVDRFRAGAASAGMQNAVQVDAISRQLGGGIARDMNLWLLTHPIPGTLAAWYYIVLQGAVTAIVGLLLIWRRVPSFPLHRNAIIACNLIGLVVFWLYPVAPPRMLPGYHDITGTTVPLFSKLLEGKAADQFAATPSLHVAWAIWAAIALGALFWRHPVLRAVVWLYPVATALDVLSTANHYMLDVITAPAVVVLGYAIAEAPALARHAGLRLSPAGLAKVARGPLVLIERRCWPSRDFRLAPGRAQTEAHFQPIWCKPTAADIQPAGASVPAQRAPSGSSASVGTAPAGRARPGPGLHLLPA
jgi:PAP2 superfamily